MLRQNLMMMITPMKAGHQINNDDDAEHELDKFMAGMEVRQSNLTTATLLEIIFLRGQTARKEGPSQITKEQ